MSIEKSSKSKKYKNVYFRQYSGVWDSFNGKHWYGRIVLKGETFEKTFVTEKEAGLYIDKILISRGKQPKNVLVKKLLF